MLQSRGGKYHPGVWFLLRNQALVKTIRTVISFSAASVLGLPLPFSICYNLKLLYRFEIVYPRSYCMVRSATVESVERSKRSKLLHSGFFVKSTGQQLTMRTVWIVAVSSLLVQSVFSFAGPTLVRPRLSTTLCALDSSPTWRDLIEAPVQISSKEEWDSKPSSKRVAMAIRASVLHLTLLSSLMPLIFRGALRSAPTGSNDIVVTPLLSIAWTICMMSWHAAHNMVNDYQDLDVDDAS